MAIKQALKLLISTVFFAGVCFAEGGEDLELVSKFKAKAPATIVRQLVQHCTKAKFDKSECPVVQLFDADGRTFEGRLLSIGTEQSNEYVTVLMGGSPLSVSYLDLNRVVGVMVQGVDRFAPLLSGGAVGRVPGEVAPTALNLQREIQSKADQLMKDYSLGFVFDLKQFPETDSCRLNLRDFVSDLNEAVKKVGRDELGKGSLKKMGKIALRYFDNAHDPEVKIKEQQIEVQLNCDRALPETLTQYLEDKINKVL